MKNDLVNDLETSQFLYRHRIYFNETNAMGGVTYFANYIKWQGIAREEYFIATCPDWKEIMQRVASHELNMITIEEHSFFIQHAFFGDEITIQLQTCNIRRCSFDMLFVIRNQNDVVLYEGIQKIAFDNFKGKFEQIPASMLRSV